MGNDVMTRHIQACGQSSEVVEAVGERWRSPTAGTAWGARGVLEHVGTHDVILRRVGAPTWFDTELWTGAYREVRRNDSSSRAPAAFGTPVPVPDDAGVGDEMVTRAGRGPGWRAP